MTRFLACSMKPKEPRLSGGASGDGTRMPSSSHTACASLTFARTGCQGQDVVAGDGRMLCRRQNGCSKLRHPEAKGEDSIFKRYLLHSALSVSLLPLSLCFPHRLPLLSLLQVYSFAPACRCYCISYRLVFFSFVLCCFVSFYFVCCLYIHVLTA